MLPLQFTSQLEYGRYGHLICTPVSCALAVSFIINNNTAAAPHPLNTTTSKTDIIIIENVFSRKRVDNVMRSAHRLYAECFASIPHNNDKQLMLSDIQNRIPADSVTYEELAGTTTTTTDNNHDAVGKVEVEDMVLESLTTVLSVLQARARMQYAVVVTMDEHTTCYLSDMGRMFHFDPLPASLRDVTCTWRKELESRPSMEYSGLILYKAE